MKHVASAAVALLLSTGLVQFAHANDLTTEELIQLLRPMSKTRSLKPYRGITVEEAISENASSPTVNLYVNFEYDSAELKQDTLIMLDNLAAALKDERLAVFDFLIGGHTDAVGSDAYNQKLSEKRAWAVKKYLMSRHSVSAQRLIEKGFGEARLLKPNEPFDGINRRVQITTLAIPTQ
jgi:outer membrane protein OmpA-like peptidoglycan-associated protein